MTILRNLFGGESRAVENPRLPLTANALINALGGGAKTAAGVSVNETSAVKKYIAVYRAVSLVSEAIAAMPLNAFKAGPNRVPAGGTFVDNPHPHLTSVELWGVMLFRMLLGGNAFASKIRDRYDTVVQLEPIEPSSVKVEPADNRYGRRFVIRYQDGRERAYTPDNILHLMGPSTDGFTGLSPIGVARQSIGSALAQEEYTGRLFGNGSLMSGILQTDARLEEPQAQALKKRWQERVGGLANAHEVAVLDSGAKFQPIGINPEDAQLIESREFQVTDIARLYGIPPHLLAQVEKSTSWGTGIEQQSLGFITYTLRPWITRMESRISKECLVEGVMAEFDTTSLQRGDAQARAAFYSRMVTFGAMTLNQVRRAENFPPYPPEWGDVPFIMANNMRPLTDYVGGTDAPQPEPLGNDEEIALPLRVVGE